VLVQTFRPEASIKGFDEGIVCRLAGPGEVKDHPALVGPEVHVALDELAALVDADRLGIPRLKGSRLHAETQQAQYLCNRALAMH